MPQGASMEEILIDRGQFALENRVEMLDDGRIAPHGRSPRMVVTDATLEG
jgi:hypothetical protein